MTNGEPARTRHRTTRIVLVAGLLVTIAAAIAPVLDHQLLASTSGTAASPVDVLGGSQRGATSSPAASPVDVLRGSQHHALGEADGVVPDGTTVFDDTVPGVAKLTPALLAALRQASLVATGDGIRIFVTSGWRSHAYQEQLFNQAVSKYGSAEDASRWVAPPGTSAHETGDAVDIGRADATAWLSRHGATYGLCQIYGNEPWHFELRPEAVDRGCPPMYADPTQDPRLHH